MKQILPFESVKKLIEKGGFGSYRLFSLPGENLIAGSHFKEEDGTGTALSPAKLIVDLEENLEIVTDGGMTTFLIELKRSNKSQATTSVRYYFTYGEQTTQPVQQSVQLAGMGEDRLEQLVSARVNQLLSIKEAEWQKQRQLDQLMNQIVELKRKKYGPKKKSNELSGLINLGLVALPAFITKQWPDTKEVVTQALGAIRNLDGDDGDEDDDDDDGTGFERPNS